MEVQPLEVVRMIIRVIGAQDTTFMNVFYAQLSEEGELGDGDVLADMTKWATKMFDYLEPVFDSNLSLGICQADVVQVEGVYNPLPNLNDAKIEVVRPIGFIAPTFVPAANGDQYTGIATGSISARTNIPRCVARKSISGFSEVHAGEGLWGNSVLNALINVAAWWMLGPSAVPDTVGDWAAGTLSLRTAEFGHFTGSADTTNVPGTMVTRKIGRGA